MGLTKNDLYLVAVSGGPDSVFLVHWLWNHGYRNLVIAHVNYHWRKESDYDQKVVELLAQKFKLPLEIKNLDTYQEKAQTQNFEAWAREQRYNFISQLSQKYHSQVAVLGHQENDLIETYLLQKQRKGVVNHFGLKKIVEHHQLSIWRPLLNYKKSFILHWLDKNKIPYAWDLTNQDLRFQRNKIRSEISEQDFARIKQQIFFDNEQNQNWVTLIKDYLKTNQKNESLFLAPEIKTWEIALVQRLVYQFFENQAFTNDLLDRKKQLLAEIATRILLSKKNFWSIALGERILIKDYNFLHLLVVKDLPKPITLLDSVDDFSKLKKFENKAQIIAIISSGPAQFPYTIYTLNPAHIKGIKWQGKSLARTLGRRKISYAKRLKLGIIYSSKQKRFIDGWAW